MGAEGMYMRYHLCATLSSRTETSASEKHFFALSGEPVPPYSSSFQAGRSGPYCGAFLSPSQQNGVSLCRKLRRVCPSSR